MEMVGADADIIIFDFAELEDKSLYPHIGKPDSKPKGIECVIINGELVVDKSIFTGNKAGKTIKI